MPSLQETLEAARQAHSSSGPSGGVQARKRPQAHESATGTGGESELATMLEHSLRLGASLADKVEGVVAACNLVVILVSQPLKDAMLQALSQWLDSCPEWKKGSPGVPHPLGEKKMFLFGTFMDLLSKDLTPDHPSQEHIKLLQAMDSSDLARWIATFRPRYATPRDGRPWVFELSVSVLSGEDFRKSLDALSMQVRHESIRIEPQRWAQSAIQKQVWEDLRGFKPPQR